MIIGIVRLVSSARVVIINFEFVFLGSFLLCLITCIN